MMKNVAIIKNGISSDDIYQGKLGNCYFLSSVSALAENPDRVRRILISKEDNKQHIYTIALNYCGVWRKIHLDAKIPTKDQSILFCHTKSAELWAILL